MVSILNSSWLYKKLILGVLVVFLMFFSFFIGKANKSNGADLALMARGEAIKMTIDNFNLKAKNKSFLKYCEEQMEECVFSFSSRSDYDQIKLKPLILYPDVFPAYRYYEEINIATLLDLTRGYWQLENSPFKPEQYLTRAEALKIILGGADLLKWKDQFEITEKVNQKNISTLQAADFQNIDEWRTDGWWKARYLVFAFDKGIITDKNSRPDQAITKQEFEDLLKKTSDYASTETEKALSA